MKKINSIFLRGLATFLPVVITIYIAVWAILLFDSFLGSAIRKFVPELYIPGMGLALTIALIFIFGLLTQNLTTNQMLSWFEEKLKEVPGVSVVYSSLKDLIGLFSKKGSQQMKSVVLIEIQPQMRVLGLVTRDQFGELPINSEGTISVYVPLSYMLGGITVLVHRAKVEPLDIPIEKAMKLALTGWVAGADQSPISESKK